MRLIDIERILAALECIHVAREMGKGSLRWGALGANRFEEAHRELVIATRFACEVAREN